MKNKLLNNIGLKVMAVLFAIILWMVAAGINNPVGTQAFYNVQVQLTNTGSITSQNKTYKVEDGTDRIRVTVRAPRTVLEELSKENISATADCSKMTEGNAVPIEVTINDRYLADSVETIGMAAGVVALAAVVVLVVMLFRMKGSRRDGRRRLRDPRDPRR